MEVITHLYQHYFVETLAALIIAGVTLLSKPLAIILTSIFSNVRISGNWETTLDRGSGPQKHEDAKVSQFIHRVWGRTTATDGTTFNFRGTIVGHRVCLVYRAKSPSTDCGANLLKILADGKSMKGFEIGIDRVADQIQPYAYEWKKKP